MTEWALAVGGFIRWLIRGFKTNFGDEINGAEKSLTGIDTDVENYILGFLTVLLLLVAFSLIFTIISN